MMRRFLVCGVFAVALAALVCWAVGMFPLAVAQNPSSEDPGARSSPALVASNGSGNGGIGGPLFQESDSRPALPLDGGVRSALDVIEIPNGRLGIIDKVDLPAQREGLLYFVGVEVKQGEVVPDKDIVKGLLREVIDPVTNKKVIKETKFRRLKDGENVEKDQLVAMVDYRLASADVKSKLAKLEASKADFAAAIETRNEAEQRWKTADQLFKQGAAVISREDWRGAFVTWERYKAEAISKEHAISVASEDLNEAKTVLEMHEVRPPISGRVKMIFKNSSEVVKREDPVILQIQNYSRLKVEGMVEPQYAEAIKHAEELEIEPTVRKPVLQTFTGHRGEIYSVAFSKGPNPVVVSGSEDRTTRVWKVGAAHEQAVWEHESPVRAVACTPPGASANLCLTGEANGTLLLWDLDQAGPTPLRVLQERTGFSVRCLAFSPDGKTCASGGDDRDREIKVWDTDTGALRYSILGHRDVITSLQFTPGSQLVSISRDRTIRVWNVGKTGHDSARKPISRQSNEVAHLGVSPDGKTVLDEQGTEMRILSLDKGLTEGAFQSANKGTNFKTLALFSPDGRLVLTANGNDGQMQVWRLGKTRINELQQLIAGDRSPITCAAFDPNGKYIAGGIKDRKVYVWAMPSDKEINLHLKAKLITVEPVVENAEYKRRIVAEMENQDEVLAAGDVVTIVAYPSKK